MVIQLVSSHLLSALSGRVQYSLVDNLECQSEVMPVYWRRIEATYKAKFKAEVDHFPQDTRRTLKRANKTGTGSVSCLRTLVEQSYLRLSFAML